jgi:hypothetical protein
MNKCIQQWEYWLMTKGSDGMLFLDRRLRELGREGWELVAVDDRYCYLKREKQ